MLNKLNDPIRARRRFLSLLLPLAASAQAPSFTQEPTVTVKDIEMLLSVKMSDDVIIARAKRSGKPMDLTTEEMIKLKQAGASDNLIRQLLTTSPASNPSPGPATTQVNPPSDRREVGVYYKRAEEWTELLAEVVNFKTGGGLKSFASGGIVSKDLNGLLTGQHSRNSVKTPLELLIVAPEGIGATEYQLVRLRENKGNREFRSVTGGIMNSQSGAMRDMVPFEGKRIGPRMFAVVLPANIGAGEYGFLPPGGASGGGGVVGSPTGAQGRMYTFRIVE